MTRGSGGRAIGCLLVGALAWRATGGLGRAGRAHRADAETYQDLAGDWVMNEVGINYSAPAVLHFALLSPG